MNKTILITGATDGIGFATAQKLAEMGHNLLLHGRSGAKLDQVRAHIAASVPGAHVECYIADLADLAAVEAMATEVLEKHAHLDVLINNAGVFKTPQTTTDDGLDTRIVVNTIAPYLLMQRLMPLFGPGGRIVNLSSAAQSSVDPKAFSAPLDVSDFEAYAMSKLAITAWSRFIGERHKADGQVIIAVNPGSLLASKMVKEGFGVAGSDIGIGVDILIRASLDDEFASAAGCYFDNDAGQFSSPHQDALDNEKCLSIVQGIEAVIARLKELSRRIAVEPSGAAID